MRYRTIPKALEELKLIDPNTSLSKYTIKKLAEKRKISQVQSGNKTMVDFDSLLAYLNGEEVQCTFITLEN